MTKQKENWEKRLFGLVCKYNREYNGTFVITESCHLKLRKLIRKVRQEAVREVLEKVRLRARNTGYPTDISWDEAIASLNAKIGEILKKEK